LLKIGQQSILVKNNIVDSINIQMLPSTCTSYRCKTCK